MVDAAAFMVVRFPKRAANRTDQKVQNIIKKYSSLRDERSQAYKGNDGSSSLSSSSSSSSPNEECTIVSGICNLRFFRFLCESGSSSKHDGETKK